MLRELAVAVKKVGLCIHPKKTKIIANCWGRRGAGVKYEAFKLEGEEIHTLRPEESTMYLGRLLNIYDTAEMHDVELNNRIAAGWRKFWAQRHELTSSSFSLKSRLKLFDSTISPCVLYGSGCWTLTADRIRKLQTNQRRMLRMIVNTRRLTSTPALESASSDSSSTASSFQLEPWIDFMQRATHIAENYASRYGVKDWASVHFLRKFRLAGHMGRRTDSRWSKKVLYWIPDGASRQRGHPHKRWTDVLDEFFKAAHGMEPGKWLNLCADRDVWASLSDAFVSFCCETQ